VVVNRRGVQKHFFFKGHGSSQLRNRTWCFPLSVEQNVQAEVAIATTALRKELPKAAVLPIAESPIKNISPWKLFQKPRFFFIGITSSSSQIQPKQPEGKHWLRPSTRTCVS
jgi:hypothetical protein